MVGVGRDLWGSSSPTPLLKQGQKAAQDLVQEGREYLQRRRLHNLPGQPVLVLRHPRRSLPHVQMELPMLQFVHVAPCPVAGHHSKEFGPILLTPTLQIFIYKIPFQASLLQAEQAQLPQPFLVGEVLQSPHHPRSPPLDSSPVGPHLSWTREPRTGQSTPDGASLGQSRGGGEPPSTCWPHSS